MWRTLPEFTRERKLTYAILALLGIISTFLFPLQFGTGPYCAVHGPLVQISRSAVYVVLAFCLNAALILMLLFGANSHKILSCDLQTLTCTRNC
jgi:hypothetical protein